MTLANHTIVPNARSMPLPAAAGAPSPRFSWWRSRHVQVLCVGLLVLTIFRLWYTTQIELVGDEAYYWVQSHHLDMCYFDKGPGVAWTIAAGRVLFGDSVFAIRFFSVLLSAGTSVWLFVLARQLFSERVAFVTVALLAIVPMFAVGSILMTIDPLSMFFWTLAACAFWKAKDLNGIGWWSFTGCFVGLGMLAKYTNAAELVSFAAFCAACPPYRKHLIRSTFGALLVATCLVSLPLWIWNSRHGWVTLHHLAARGALDSSWSWHPAELLKFVASQAGVISPLLFAGILVAVFSAARNRPVTPERCFLLSLFLPLAVGYTLVSINRAAQPNWTAPCYLAGFILLAGWWPHWAGLHPRWRWLGILAIGISLLETTALHNTAWLHLPPGKDPLDRARGWDDLATKVAHLKVREGADFIIARNYTTASLLSFYTSGKPFVYLPTTAQVSNQFSIWDGYQNRAAGSTALFISESALPPKVLRAEFRKVINIGELSPQAGARTLAPYHVFVCQGLHAFAAVDPMDKSAAP